ncbi:unnamed protein product [Chironomus riparius]|uniref:Uncharacterized protein n=1 Tax=Chironomus riparius TaxID=315576 RepID=A0A9N9RRH3_9DIPT|nr:unnamed protein product [Chironomus riparius]
MSLDRKKSDCNMQQQQQQHQNQQQHHQQHENPSGSNECLLQKRSTKHRDSLSKKSDQTVPRMYSGDDVEVLRLELENETRNRNEAQRKYSELHHKVEAFMQHIDEAKKNPESKYDALIYKQNCVNDTVAAQLSEAKDKLASLTHSLKSVQVCGKDCQLTSKDLMLNYDCMTKNEILKEIKKFERMQIDLKSNLDRLQYKIDHESKEYYNLVDQFQKLQIELYYLQNLNDKHSSKVIW